MRRKPGWWYAPVHRTDARPYIAGVISVPISTPTPLTGSLVAQTRPEQLG